jgi:hypothetical protein
MLHIANNDIGYLLLHSQRKRMTAIVIIYIIFIIFSAKIDAEHINRQQYFSDHFSRFVLRFVVTLGMSSGVLEFVLLSSLFWAIFDITLNYFTGNKLLYVGKTAWIDKQFNKIPIVYFLLKIIVLTISVICYI